MVSTAKSFPYILKESATVLGSMAAQNSLVLDEHHFVRMLRTERKRTERSAKPFMLMLLNGGEMLQRSALVHEIATSVTASTRETDTLGWYTTGSVLGILFTELGTSELDAILKIVHKVSKSLGENLEREDATQLKVTYHIYPEDTANKGKHSTDIRLYPDLQRLAERKKDAHLAKRILDVAGSLIAILVLSPVFLAVAAAIKLTSPGPVLFRQKRIGQYGNTFTFLKFRSMKTNNDSKIHEDYVKKLIAGQSNLKQPDINGGVFKLTNDPRVTSVGRFIRRTSLDELPQFFNVLGGNMSLVGPRPPVPYEYESYDVWHRHRMIEVKPGITGLWQVTGRSRTTFDEMVRLDLQYAESWSLALDLKILFQTPKAVLSGNGAH
jgi:exopolysaccharide biosynthesis polyprenyl glycosylphosphotransferase